MTTHWTKTLIPTARQVPADAEVPSHQLMLRAGLIRRLGSGVYDYLPLGLRSLRRAAAIVREEMDRTGAIEVAMPTLHPIELWERTGRRAAYGQNLFVVEDRHGRKQALGPTHEEVFTELVSGVIESYKQLPVTLYQIQTKFRDEFRPRFGVLRSREFLMKDAYSFHLTLDGPGGLDETYQKQYEAYCKIMQRCGLPYEPVEAESGPIGGSASHEFMVPSPTGEDVILKSDKGNYAANVEKCEIGPREHTFDADPTGELEKVHTPDCASIDHVTAFFKKDLKTKLKPQNMLKTLVYKVFKESMNVDVRNRKLSHGEMTMREIAAKTIIAVVRGDHEVNEAKLRLTVSTRFPEFDRFELAEPDSFGWLKEIVGFVGPHLTHQKEIVTDPPARSRAFDQFYTAMYIDPDAAKPGFWVTGANEVDHHVKHFNWKRDVIDPLGDQADEIITVADIRNAVDGDPSPKNDGGVLQETKGIELGHVFKLGDKYTKAMDVTVADENNERRHPIMGCYGIGVNRILAAAIERDSDGVKGHDENGIIWPRALAPFDVIVTPIAYTGRVKEVADQLAADIEQAGYEVLIDDRDERPGVKFKDADLIGIPLRITIGDKTLANDQVELKPRTAAKPDMVAIPQAAQTATDLLKTL